MRRRIKTELPQEIKNMINNYIDRIKYALIGAGIATCITLIVMFTLRSRIKPEKPLKCVHLTEKQILTKYISYEVFVDSMYSCQKKDVPRFTDSLVKYQIKTLQDSPAIIKPTWRIGEPDKQR